MRARASTPAARTRPLGLGRRGPAAHHLLFAVLLLVIAAVTRTKPAAAGTRDLHSAHRDATATGVAETDPGEDTVPPPKSPVEDQENPPVARLAVTQLGSPALTVAADASASTDADLTPVARYRFDFGDGTPAVTTTAPAASAQHTYAMSGRFTVTVIVTDTGGNASTPASVIVPVAGRLTAERRVATSSDDAEERAADGTMKLGSSTLQLTMDGTTSQSVGLRFAGIPVANHATVVAAYLQLSSSASQTGATALTIAGEAADDAATFSSAAGNIASRARTAASVAWAPNAWTSGQAGAEQRTPDLTAVIQEIVNRPDWAAGHALALIVTGSGSRTAASFDASPTTAPLLHIEYLGVAAPPTARLALSQASSPALTANVDASASTPGASPIATCGFDFGDGTQAVTSAPDAPMQHCYSAAGTYTVTLVVTDTAGRRSDPATASVTIEDLPPRPIAVYVGYYDTHHPDRPRTKPSPWYGSSGITFVGTPDSGSGGWDSSGIRIDNLTSSSLVVTVTCDIGADHFGLWGTRTIPAHGVLVLAQTGFENFDGSDTNEAGCYACDPDDCITKVSSTVPVVHVVLNGARIDYFDTGQVMNTYGADLAGCPYTGTRNDESQEWTPIYPQSSVAMASPEGAVRAQLDEAPTRGPRLDPVSPNPAADYVALRFEIPVRQGVCIGIYDVSGRLVKSHLDGEMDPGEYMSQIGLGGIPAGMYYLALRSGGRTLHQRFVHVR